MPKKEDETHHVAGDVTPLVRRPKPEPKQAKPPDPTDTELFRAHQLSQSAAVESPEELTERLARLHAGLESLEEQPVGEDEDLPPAS